MQRVKEVQRRMCRGRQVYGGWWIFWCAAEICLWERRTYSPSFWQWCQKTTSNCSITQGLSSFQRHLASNAWPVCFTKPWLPLDPTWKNSEQPVQFQSYPMGGLSNLYWGWIIAQLLLSPNSVSFSILLQMLIHWELPNKYPVSEFSSLYKLWSVLECHSE